MTNPPPILFASLVFIGIMIIKHINNPPVKIGDKYLHSWNFQKKDPFEKIDIDTVVVIDIKGEYVLYQKNGVNYHNRFGVFKSCIKPIK
jgi:hypothetical protein